MQQDPNTIWTRENNLWSHRAHAQPMQTHTADAKNPKHHLPRKPPKLDTADAQRIKHQLDTSREPPKRQAKKLFHVTFGIHIKQKQFLEPQSPCRTLQMQKDPTTIWTLAETTSVKAKIEDLGSCTAKFLLPRQRSCPRSPKFQTNPQTANSLTANHKKNCLVQSHDSQSFTVAAHPLS